MNDYNIKKRLIRKFSDYKNPSTKVEKKPHDIVKRTYSGPKKGDKGYDTLESANPFLNASDAERANIVKDLRLMIEKDLGKQVTDELVEGLASSYLAGKENCGEIYKIGKDLKAVLEKYEMDLDGGDMGDEHAKMVIAEAIDGHKETGKFDMQGALDKVAKDWDLDGDMKIMVLDSLINILRLMKDATVKLK